MDYLEGLNQKQKDVVTTTKGPVLVLAGAGSGKTLAIIRRTAYLINKEDIAENDIFIVTFTNKAAVEIKSRLAMIGISSYPKYVGTFHSICLRILRDEYKSINFNSNFTIYDADDQKSLMKKIIKQKDIDKNQYPAVSFLNKISRHKSKNKLPKDLLYLTERGPSNKIIYDVYKLYQEQLVKNNSMDFDDILLYTYRLLKENTEVRKRYQEQFKYVMIDEYQDTNNIQFKLAKILAEPQNNICVVGDDDQSIYSWRGADIKNILGFGDKYEKTKIVRMEQNYRSTDKILGVANELISHNSERHEKNLWSGIESSNSPEIKRLESNDDEARYVRQKIQDLLSDGYKLDEIAILYRTNAQSRVLETEFNRAEISYQIVGGINFYQRAEIKDLVSYLKVIVNPYDRESLERIINNPTRGISKKTINALNLFSIEEQISSFEALSRADEIESLTKRAKKSVKEFYEMLLTWRNEITLMNCYEFCGKLVNDIDIIRKFQAKDDPKFDSKVENIKEFINFTAQFNDDYRADTGSDATVDNMLEKISLLTDLDSLTEDVASVKLLTIHNSKGLEYRVVFIVGLVEGILPHQRSLDSRDETELEEERRLLYVAITRAKELLYFSLYNLQRMYGKFDAVEPSRFTSEISGQCSDMYSLDRGKRSRQKRVNIHFGDDYFEPRKKKIRKKKVDSHIYRDGVKVYHERFGSGIIISCRGEGSNRVATVSFKSGELKKIVVNYLQVES